MVAVSGGSGTTAVHVGSKVMDLLAVFVGYDGSFCCTGVGAKDKSVLH